MSFQWAPWPLPAAVRCGWTTREVGYSGGVLASNNMAQHVLEDDAVACNRALLRQRLPGQPQITWLNQTHSTRVIPLGQADIRKAQDGAVTSEWNQACCVMTADCLPVFLWTAAGDRVAAIHAGWRGLAAGILNQALARFAQTDQLYAGIGPAISQSHFEVGEDVRQAFLNWPDAAACFMPGKRSGKFQCDLPGLATAQLTRLGVRHVYHSGLCTFGNASQFYSYRRDGQTGRMANLIWRSGI